MLWFYIYKEDVISCDLPDCVNRGATLFCHIDIIKKDNMKKPVTLAIELSPFKAR